MFPAWDELWTAREVTEQLNGLEFKGPGLYCEPNETTLIINPVSPQNMDTQPADFKYRVYVFNSHVKDTILGLANQFPVREDTA
jgi:hypothetical protein